MSKGNPIFAIRLTPETHAALDRLAEARSKPVVDLVRAEILRLAEFAPPPRRPTQEDIEE